MNGDLEEVYMELSPRFDQGRKVRKVYKIRKSLYGLKQSFYAWFKRFTNAIMRHGYT